MTASTKTANSLPMPDRAAQRPPVVAGRQAGRVVRQLLGQLLDSLEAYEAGISRTSPPAKLHGYRIALRRSRTLISAFANALPHEFAAIAEELRWIARVSGQARDLDVHLHDLEALEGDLKSVPIGAGTIGRHLKRERTQAYAALRRALQSRRYERLKEHWRAALALPLARKAERKPIEREAERRIAKIRKKFLKEGGAITSASPAEEFHDLRKRGKKLRYMLEFFASLYPEQVIRHELRNLKALQSVLGRFQDLESQRLFLENLAQTLPIEGQEAAAIKTSLHALAQNGARCQHDCRLGVAEAFERCLSRAL